MGRRTWIVLLGLALLGGCRSKEDVKYLGRWEGGFTVHRLTARTQINDAKRNNWKGYVLFYRTEDPPLGSRLQMHLENEQEVIDLKGHWNLRGRQIESTFNDIKIDDAGGPDDRDPNKSYVLANDIRRTFRDPLILNIARDQTHLSSPLVEFGPLEGEYAFTKATMGR